MLKPNVKFKEISSIEEMRDAIHKLLYGNAPDVEKGFTAENELAPINKS